MKSKSHPLVSVIVPTHNRVGLLSQTVATILGQTVSDLELIIIVNKCEDRTEGYINSLRDSRVRYLKNDRNNIIATSRNLGIQSACGKYIAFCDDDDLWMPKKLEKQLAVFPEHGISCVATDYIPIGKPEFLRKTLPFTSGESLRDLTYEDVLVKLNPIVNSSVITRRDFLVETNGLDENPDFRFIEDWELWLRLSRKGKIRIVSEPLVQYRMLRKVGREAILVRVNTLKVIGKHFQLGYFDEEIKKEVEGNSFVSIGTAFLEVNDREGLAFYRRGLFQSKGWYSKAKSLMGIFLFCLPLSFRRRVFNFLFAIAGQQQRDIEKETHE